MIVCVRALDIIEYFIILAKNLDDCSDTTLSICTYVQHKKKERKTTTKQLPYHRTSHILVMGENIFLNRRNSYKMYYGLIISRGPLSVYTVIYRRVNN